MIRVLVVDDHPALRAGLERLLRAEPGFTCAGTAADAAGLEHELGRARADVVLLDLRLGEEDGIELLPDVATRVPVVAFSADAGDPQVAGAARRAGAADCVDKAADLPVLLDALRLAARRGAPAS